MSNDRSHSHLISPRTYPGELLSEDFGDVDPSERFVEWFAHARDHDVIEPDAATLSTFDGKAVNARTVALRGIVGDQLLFYTNYHSRKAKEIDAQPHVAVTFYWKETFRQVRLRGEMTKVSEQQSDEYFASRPRGSQISAWVSRQSEQVGSREEINESYAHYEKQLTGAIERPPFWGGYTFTPHEYEFMQGHENRLHDRFLFTLDDRGHFQSRRLWP
jgi:pyridoxamine 5'-phosphate oxidase